MAPLSNFFNRLSGAETPTPTSTATPTLTPTPTPVATPEAAETTGRPNRKAARQARVASENAAAASKAAANASAQAVIASKQAASVANQVEGTGPANADVSLEASPGATAPIAPSTPAAATPSAATSVANVAPVGTPSLSSPAPEESSSSGDADPAKAAKLIKDIDKLEKRVDRKNLSADDSQRDILAQKLLQEAKNALAERDSVAAMSLATKASTLLAPLAKLTDSANPSAP